MCIAWWLFALCLSVPARGADAIPGEDYCVERQVSDIQFEGNKVTRPGVMLREAVQSIGTPCSLDDIIDSIQSIMDLGLFKSVRAEISADGDSAAIVRFIVTEKIFFLAIPRISRTSDGELRGGLQLRWDNFSGRLHQLKITSEKRQEDDGQGRTGYVHSVDYDVPRFLGSNFGLAVGISGQRRQVELGQDEKVFGEAVNTDSRFGMVLSRWISHGEGVQGLRYFAGFGFVDRQIDVREGGLGPFTGGRDVSLVVGAENRRLHLDSYRRRGFVYGGRLGVAAPVSELDLRYHRADLYLAWYRPLAAHLSNLNLQARLGLSDGAAFGERAYSIGGGEVLRGMPPGRYTGDIMTLVNVDYLRSFFSYPNWRWVVFGDFGNVYLHGKFKPLKQFLRTGVGLRWKIEALTNTDLRLDLAWDPEGRRARAYVASKLNF